MEQQRFFFYCPFSESSQRKNDRGARQTERSRHREKIFGQVLKTQHR